MKYIRFKSNLQRFMNSFNLYRAEKEIDGDVYKIWTESDNNWRLEIWKREYYECHYTVVDSKQALLDLLPSYALVADDWWLHGILPS